MRFEWDDAKAEANLRKHGIGFEEAQSVFVDPLSLVIDDVEHSQEKERSVVVGTSYRNRLLVVVFIDRNQRMRLISARRATRRERIQYEAEAIG